MFVWVRFGSSKEIVNIDCTCNLVLDYILRMYDGDNILNPNHDDKWQSRLAEYDLADENGYITQMNKNLTEVASTLLEEREVYCLTKITSEESGGVAYTPLIEQDDETPYHVKDVVRPKGFKNDGKEALQKRKEKEAHKKEEKLHARPGSDLSKAASRSSDEKAPKTATKEKKKRDKKKK